MIKRRADKLHRVGKNDASDWEKVPENERTKLQRIADKTNGFVTVGNAMSVAGLLIFTSGLSDYRNKRFLRGTVKMGTARLIDVIDGWGAEKTKTRSLTGAGVDASIDMIEALVALPVLRSTDTIGKVATGITAAQRSINALGSTVGKLRGVRIDAHETGKIGAFIMWGGILSAMFGKTAESKFPKTSNVFKSLGNIGILSGAINSMPATVDYVRKGFAPKPITPLILIEPSELDLNQEVIQADPWIAAAFGGGEWPANEPHDDNNQPVVE